MVFQNNVLSGAAGSGTTVHTIDQSIRFDLASATYMQRTHGAGGNADLATVSFWFKRSTFGVEVMMFGTGADVYNTFDIFFKTDNTMVIQNYASSYQLRLITNQVFRDPSAWYHVVFAYDSANGISTDRAKLYINGERVTSFGTETYPSQNQDSILGTNVAIGFGRYISYGSSNTNQYFPGYLAEMHYVNGSALDPSSFGEYNDSGIWIPKEYSGSYGTGGFKVDGRDSSDLGDDESGQGNDLTTSGLAAHDQVSDSPTNNFCTINSIYADNAPAGNAGTLSNGNLQYAGSGSSFCIKGFTFNLPKSGKWYFEYMIGGTNDGFGFIKQGEQGSISASNGPGNVTVAQGGGIQYSGWRNGGNFTVNFGTTFTAGHIHQVAIDVDNGKFFYGVQNTYYAADAGTDGNPSAGTNETSTFAFSTTDVVLLAGNYSGTQYWNFGQDGTFAGQQTAQGNSDANGVGNFYYAVPTGYKALCSKNVGS